VALSWSWAVIFARPDGPETIGGTDSRLGSCLLCHKELWFPPFGACMQGVREFRSDIVAGLRASDRGVARRSWPWGCRSRDRCVAYGVEPGCRLRAASRAGVTAADGGFCGHRCAGTRIPAPAAIPWARRVAGHARESGRLVQMYEVSPYTSAEWQTLWKIIQAAPQR
jgi:hypothetical protein